MCLVGVNNKMAESIEAGSSVNDEITLKTSVILYEGYKSHTPKKNA